MTEELFPSILPDREFIDDSYNRSELENKDWDELRSIAVNHPNEDVNGKSSQEEIIEELTGEPRV